MSKHGYVCILASKRRGTLYIGVTSRPAARIAAHRAGTGSAFVRRWRIRDLVYLEAHERIADALAREKAMK